ncbi:MAG: recombination protein O N-terminal domain-containing protein, partial [Planctomycetota bacterium]
MKPQRRARGADRGLLLRRFPYGESSLVLHVLTRTHGRLALLAKGAYRPSSAYFAAFDLFDTLELSFGAPKGEGLALVT